MKGEMYKSTKDIAWEEWSKNQQSWKAVEVYDGSRNPVYVETTATACGFVRLEGSFRKFKARHW